MIIIQHAKAAELIGSHDKIPIGILGLMTKLDISSFYWKCCRQATFYFICYPNVAPFFSSETSVKILMQRLHQVQPRNTIYKKLKVFIKVTTMAFSVFPKTGVSY